MQQTRRTFITSAIGIAATGALLGFAQQKRVRTLSATARPALSKTPPMRRKRSSTIRTASWSVLRMAPGISAKSTRAHAAARSRRPAAHDHCRERTESVRRRRRAGARRGIFRSARDPLRCRPQSLHRRARRTRRPPRRCQERPRLDDRGDRDRGILRGRRAGDAGRVSAAAQHRVRRDGPVARLRYRESADPRGEHEDRHDLHVCGNRRAPRHAR